MTSTTVRGFVFDIDGTLLHRGPDGRGRPQPGAPEVLARIRATGRRLALFTNGSHVPSARIAAGLRDDGLDVADDELITPVDSATGHILARHREDPVLLFASEPCASTWSRAVSASSMATTPGSCSSPTASRSTSTTSTAPPARLSPGPRCTPAATCPAMPAPTA